MKLRTKLFYTLGILFLGYSVIFFFLPRYIISRDVQRVTTEIYERATKKDAHLINNRQVLLYDIFTKIKEGMHASLLMVYEMPEMQKKLTSQQTRVSWPEMLWLLTFDPDIGLVQVNSKDEKTSALFLPAEKTFIPLQKVQGVSDKIVFETQAKEQYLAIPLPVEADTTFYALLQPNENDIPSFKDQLSGFKLGVSPHPMLQVLVQIALPKGKVKGVATKNREGDLEGLFTNSVMQHEPIFDAQSFYMAHAPAEGEPPIATSYALVADKHLSHLYLVNTMRSEDIFLTLGVPIDPLAKQLAVWSEKSVIIQVGNEVWQGYNSAGSDYTPKDITEFAKRSSNLAQVDKIREGALETKTGVITLNNETYHYEKILTLEEGAISFILLTKLTGEQSIANLAISSGQRLANVISTQLFLISFFVGALILFLILRRMLTLVVRPITHLAEDTEQVVEGTYTDVRFPDVGERKDEIATLVRAFQKMVTGLSEKEKIRSVLDKVVSKDIAEEILKSNVKLGGEDREVTVLFADIRGFTSLTSKMSPQETITMLNTCMTKLTKLIETEGGVVDKYVGDEIMAIYNAPNTNPNHAINAVSTGLLMLKTIDQWNEERERQGLAKIQIGIGIHTGVAVAGNMGAEDRLNYTVLGSNVNLAARLCDAASPGQMIISESTYQSEPIRENFNVKQLDPVKLKGIEEPVPIYEIVDFKWDNE